MGYQKLLQQMIGMTLVLLLLVGCGALATAQVKPTATPGPTFTPSITPTPDLPSMVLAMAPVVSGQGVPVASEYDPDKPGPHPVLILSTFGTVYSMEELSGLPSSPWNSNLPPGWLPSSVDKTELVVLVGPEKQISLGSAPYTKDGNTYTIYRIRYEQEAEIRVARTGQTLATYLFTGSDPPDFPQVSWESILYGSRFSYQTLEGWICPMVNRQACWMLEKEVETGTTNSGNIAFSPDGNLLASGTADGALLLWDTASWSRVQTIIAHKGAISSVAFSPDGLTLASGSKDGTILLTETDSWTTLGILVSNNAPVFSVAFSPDGRTLASGSEDGAVIFWDVKSGTSLRTLMDHTDSISSVAFSPDGLTLASGSKDGTIILTNVATGSVLGTLARNNSAINYVAFSPDGHTLAGGYDFSSILLWDIASGTILRDFMNGFGFHFCFAFSPDGSILVGDDAGMEFWDVASGTLLKNPIYQGRPYFGIAFSPDGLTLVGLNDYELQIWK